MPAAADPPTITPHATRSAWPRALHPYTRNLIRWRGQHLAIAARALHQGHEDWELARLARYDRYDGRTNENPTPSASPRILTMRSHYRVWIPPARTDAFEVGLHTIDLTPFLHADALERMQQEDLFDAYLAYLNDPHPPTIYRAHKRKGIVPSDEARFAGELRTAVGILGWHATRRELVPQERRVERRS